MRPRSAPSWETRPLSRSCRRPYAWLAWLALGACNTTPTEVRPTPDAADPVLDQPAPQAPGGDGLFTDRTRVLDPNLYRLESSQAELETGLYRYRAIGGTDFPDVARDDFVVGAVGEPYVRLALASEQVGDELIVETGYALWSDVIQSGRYGVTIPFSPSAGPAQTFDGVTLEPIAVGLAGVPIPLLESDLPELDICQIAHDLIAAISQQDPQICGKERNANFAVGVVEVSIAGTVDSLILRGGHVALEGDMDIAMDVDGGGITGGSAPIFAPCNRGAYLGCLATPTGANLIDFLRRYAPQIPDGSLPSIRVCIPGSPVRVRAGYWDRSGFLPRWVPPVFEQCRITNIGDLPTIVLPAVEQAQHVARPHVKGEMLIRVRGDGSLGLKIPIPSMGATAGYKGTHFAAKASAGLFIYVSVALKNGGGTVKVTFDERGVVEQTWTETDGWSGDYESTERSTNAQLVYYDNPDSIVIRAGALAEVSAELCAALISCGDSASTASAADSLATSAAEGAAEVSGPLPSPGLTDLAVVAKASAGLFFGAEVTWDRPQVNPADPLSDNYHYDIDILTEVKLEAGLKVPLVGWAIPQALREWKWKYEFGRIPVMDLYGTGELRVVARTSGGFPDPDGYTVLVSRYDTLPNVIDAGPKRLGKPRDWGSPLSQSVGVVDSVTFSQPVPCGAYYSDVLLLLDPTYQAYWVVSGLRALGVSIPTWALTSKCDLLIARYNVELGDVAENCVVVGGALKDDVWLLQVNHSLNRPDNLQRVEFQVDCGVSAPLGNVEVTVNPSGLSQNPYRLLVDGAPGAHIAPSGTTVVTGLAPGDRVLGLTDLPVGCGATPDTVTVIASQNVAAVLAVACTPPPLAPGEVRVNSTKTGAGDDADGFDLRVDGISTASLAANGSATIAGVAAAQATVLHVANIDPTCRATSPNPRVVTLDASATPVTIAFGSECSAAVIDTIIGSVEAASWPTPSVSIRDAGGIATSLKGYVLGEIAQLSGSSARVWGVRSGTTLDVYGYDLRSQLTDTRSVGVVAIRNNVAYLFGEGVIRLIDPPSGLLARINDLVWVSGPTDAAGVRPFIYGVLREN